MLSSVSSSRITKSFFMDNETFFTKNYYMALSHKDWELPNSRIWLAETDIYFPI